MYRGGGSKNGYFGQFSYFVSLTNAKDVILDRNFAEKGNLGFILKHPKKEILAFALEGHVSIRTVNSIHEYLIVIHYE